MSEREYGYSEKTIRSGVLDDSLRRLYGPELTAEQRERYAALAETFRTHFGAGNTLFFSSPGRTELGGNHTDHNRGKVLAAGIHLDNIAVVRPRNEKRVTAVTAGIDESIEVELDDLIPRSEEQGSAVALLRGCAAYLERLSYRVGGFDAYIDSRVAIGSGLSSSASVEMLFTHILNVLYNGGQVDRISMAKAGQHAENHFFGKPSGLMDQLACSLGSIQYIDLENPQRPRTLAVNADFASRGYRLCTVDTGGDHADLTEAYASIPQEMGCAAAALGVEELRGGNTEKLLSRIAEVRRRCGDRAVLRSIHFYQENERVSRMHAALEEGDIDNYIQLVKASGRSSWTQLQNCIPPGAEAEQPIPFTLAVSQSICPRGVFRVHGGGFAGSIQGYVPQEEWESYVRSMEELLGEGAVTPLYIRPYGVVRIDEERLD